MAKKVNLDIKTKSSFIVHENGKEPIVVEGKKKKGE